MSVQSIASKYRRALRNGTGASFTLEQLQELAGHGVLELIARIEAEGNYVPRKQPAHLPRYRRCCHTGGCAGEILDLADIGVGRWYARLLEAQDIVPP